MNISADGRDVIFVDFHQLLLCTVLVGSHSSWSHILGSNRSGRKVDSFPPDRNSFPQWMYLCDLSYIICKLIFSLLPQLLLH